MFFDTKRDGREFRDRKFFRRVSGGGMEVSELEEKRGKRVER